MTFKITRDEVRNRLLNALPGTEFDLVAPQLEPMVLSTGLVMETPGELVEDVVFVESGIASRIVVGTPNGETECGHIGFEGMTGKPVVLGDRKAINRIEVALNAATDACSSFAAASHLSACIASGSTENARSACHAAEAPIAANFGSPSTRAGRPFWIITRRCAEA